MPLIYVAMWRNKKRLTKSQMFQFYIIYRYRLDNISYQKLLIILYIVDTQFCTYNLTLEDEKMTILCQGGRYRTISAGTADIYHSSTCIGIRMQLFRIDLYTGRISRFQAYRPVQKKKKYIYIYIYKFCNFRLFVRVEW